MGEDEIHKRIEELVAEEQEIWQSEGSGAADDDRRRRLDSLKVTLDQCWDLLRQRRALREAGVDEKRARVRDPEVVENYRQ